MLRHSQVHPSNISTPIITREEEHIYDPPEEGPISVVNAEEVEQPAEVSSDHEPDGPRRDTAITRCPYFPIAMIALQLSMVSSMVILALDNRIITIPTDLYLSEQKQLFESWSVKPFTEVMISDASIGCSEGFESILYRVWGGTESLCLLHPSDSEEFKNYVWPK